MEPVVQLAVARQRMGQSAERVGVAIERRAKWDQSAARWGSVRS